MQSLITYLRRFFDTSENLQEELSEKWRPHTNRRTTIIVVIFALVATSLYLFVLRPPQNFPVNKLVSVPEGSLSSVSATLKEQGVIRSEYAFQAFVTIFGDDRTVRAGDYLFKQERNIVGVARAISNGVFGLEPIRIRIVEGATTREMAIIFRSQLERFDEQNFLALAQPKEGYLFPDTYFFLPNATEETVIQSMTQNFDNRIRELEPLILESGRSLDDIIKMASIIEREARIPEDRRLISGVLWNRIEKGMALQVDAVFLYSIGKSTFQLTLADLASDSPYNTYRQKGLPPTPIGSPSLDSIEAAAKPTPNKNLFYLADRYGRTYYSRTYKEHLQKKALYID